MVLQLNSNNMELKFKQHDLKYNRKAIISVAIGTGIGLLVYIIFLYFHIDIYGWNLGLIFAPLAAGYAETIVANYLLGENIGAISAFILFIDTIIYSFILKNPTLGFNFITAGSIIVILQAAFPTLINYILLVVVGGILSGFANTIKKFERYVKHLIQNQKFFAWETPNEEIITEALPYFDENASNEEINSLNFYFITSTDMKNRPHNTIGIFQSEVIIEKDEKLIKLEPDLLEQEHLKKIKEGKDKCLINIANKIKKEGGNGIVDLTMNYTLIGLGGENIQITVMGMGIYIK